jgi:hypothetical protein
VLALLVDLLDEAFFFLLPIFRRPLLVTSNPLAWHLGHELMLTGLVLQLVNTLPPMTQHEAQFLLSDLITAAK